MITAVAATASAAARSAGARASGYARARNTERERRPDAREGEGARVEQQPEHLVVRLRLVPREDGRDVVAPEELRPLVPEAPSGERCSRADIARFQFSTFRNQAERSTRVSTTERIIRTGSYTGFDAFQPATCTARGAASRGHPAPDRPLPAGARATTKRTDAEEDLQPGGAPPFATIPSSTTARSGRTFASAGGRASSRCATRITKASAKSIESP
jgi:hypothetical protein